MDTRASLDAPSSAFDATGPASCAGCLGVACADLYVQCEQSAGCYAGLQCAALGGGGDDVCGCLGPEDAPVLGPYLALARCMQEAACAGSCEARCQGADANVALAACGEPVAPSCGGVGPEIPESTTAACDACVARSCGEFAMACGSGSDCQGYVVCLATCGGSTCTDHCGAAKGAGQSAAEALDVCLGGDCAEACGF